MAKINELNAAIGEIIKNHRLRIGLSGKALAEKLGMSAPQLSKIENGYNLPGNSILERIASALGIEPAELIEAKRRLKDSYAEQSSQKISRLANPVPGTQKAKYGERFVQLHVTQYYDENKQDKTFDDQPLRLDLPTIADQYLNLEDDIGIGHFTNFTSPPGFQVNEHDAMALAAMLRDQLGVGSMPTADLIPLLEAFGFRIVFTSKLPFGIKAKAFYDTSYQTYFICLSDNATAEGQLYDLAAELAYAYLFARENFQPVTYTNSVGVFVRAFCSMFLMPRAALLVYVDQLNIDKNDWNFKLVCALKWRFRVSAHAFIYQLLANGLISSKRFQEIKDEIHAYYEANPEALEPNPAPPLPRDTWLNTLKVRAQA